MINVGIAAQILTRSYYIAMRTDSAVQFQDTHASFQHTSDRDTSAKKHWAVTHMLIPLFISVKRKHKRISRRKWAVKATHTPTRAHKHKEMANIPHVVKGFSYSIRHTRANIHRISWESGLMVNPSFRQQVAWANILFQCQ